MLAGRWAWPATCASARARWPARKTRHHQLGRAGRVRVRLSGAFRIATGGRRRSASASCRAQEARRRARAAHRRTRGEARRMPDTDGSLMRRAAVAACLFLMLASGAAAQHAEPPGLAPAPASPEFLTRYDFHLSPAAEPATPDDVDDPRFVVGHALRRRPRRRRLRARARTSMLVDYEAVLGNEFRPFDPNQGNYTLEALVVRARRTGRRSPACSTTSRATSATGPSGFRSRGTCSACACMRRVDGRRHHGRRRRVERRQAWCSTRTSTTTGPANVDVLDPASAQSARRRVRPRYGEMFGDRRHAVGRGHARPAGRVEGGVRLNGRGGALELFAGYERGIDADPLDRQPQRLGARRVSSVDR